MAFLSPLVKKRPTSTVSAKPTRRRRLRGRSAARRRPDPTPRDQEPREPQPRVMSVSWRRILGPIPKGLKRWKWLHDLGWYELLEKDPVLTSTRQAVPTSPALVETVSTAYTGRPLGMDERTGQIVASDPFDLYRMPNVTQSVNVLIGGDVGVAKSTLVKDHYVLGALERGRQVCVFDRKRQQKVGGKEVSGHGEYGRAARFAADSGLVVANVAFSTTGGATINILDPQISVRGNAEAGIVGQDHLLVMLAELAHGALTSEERHCLTAAHRVALDRAAAEGRVAVLSDVVEALYTLTPDQAPHPNVEKVGLIDQATLVGWGLKLAMDLSRSDIKRMVDGESRDADGRPLDLAADFLVIDTSDLAEGSAQLVLVMALMSSYVSAVWGRTARESVVVVEEGYSADLPTAGAVFKSLAKRGRGDGQSLVFVVHHLSDVPEDSPLRSLIKEVGVVHVFRQKIEADAEDFIRTFGLPVTVQRLTTLPKGTHILQEGTEKKRPVRAVSHVQTEADKWVTFTDDVLNARAAPPSPFPEDHDDTRGRTSLTAPDEEGVQL